MLRHRIFVLAAVSLVHPGTARAQRSATPDLAQISLEDLMQIEVTSVSKKEQQLAKTAAAVFVIDAEMIRRSGATNVPDLLRMAPGVSVAQADGGRWVISIRGFADIYANKVLVLVDGRSAYRPTFAGVRWDELDMPLQNIERIEVIRGPGGTVWGANAMNGVINIITKKAEATQGGLIVVSGSSQTNAGGLIQYGGTLGSNASYRVFHKYFNIATLASAGKTPAADGSHGFHEGFRTDWNLGSRDTLTVQGDLLQSEGGSTLIDVPFTQLRPLTRTFADPIKFTGGNVLARWNRTLANGSDISLQFYDDFYVRKWQGLRESSNTIDLDFKHHIPSSSRHDVVWGFGYRNATSTVTPGYYIRLVPPHRRDNLFSVFVQDEIRLTNSLFLTLGSKFERNSYTGFEYEPSAQIAWQFSKRQTLWASAARAIRQPAPRDLSLQADSLFIPLENGTFGVVRAFGALKVQTEQLRDFEVGHRTQINPRLALDSVGFLSSYPRLAAFEPGAPVLAFDQGSPLLTFPQVLDYKAHARNYGVEVFATWAATRRWKLSPGFSVLHMNLVSASGVGTTEDPGNSPRHSIQLRSQLNLTRNLEWDGSLSSVGRLRDIPGYTRLDSRLGWRMGERLQLSVTGQNLLTPRHSEYPDQYQLGHTQVRRSVSASIEWKF